MKKFGGYEEASEAAKRQGGERLPVGAYEVEIKNVQYVSGENGNSDRIDILFDIAAGDYKDFFKKKYDADKTEDKKWKGRKSIYVPKDDGSEKDEWTKNTFAKWTNAFEDSNDKYKWDWKEDKWKGLKVGLVFGETGTVIEGREIVYTEPRFAVAINKVRDGSAPKAKFVSKNGYTGTTKADNPAPGSEGWMKVPENGPSEIPF